MPKVGGGEVWQRLVSLMRFFAVRGNEADLADILRNVYGSRDGRSPSAKRQFFRDKDRIQDLLGAFGIPGHESGDFILFDRRKGAGGKYVLKGGQFFMPLHLSSEDVESLITGLRLAAHFLPSCAASAKRVWKQIGSMLPDSSLQERGRMLGEATAVALPVSRVSGDTFRKILEAIFSKKVLRVTQYRTYRGEERSFRISPWSVYFKYHSWYLWGIAEGYTCPGPFRISRMQIVQLESEAGYCPPSERDPLLIKPGCDFNPEEPMRSYTICLRIFPPFSFPAADTEWFPGQKVYWEDRRRGILRYEAHVSGLDDVTRWVMRALECFEILGPDELAKRVREKIDGFLLRNSRDKGGQGV